MINFALARKTMVDNQIRPSDVTDGRVIDAFSAVPREVFVPKSLQALAYIDEHLQVKAGTAGAPPRFLMQPAPLARLVQLAEIAETDRVLVVGAATGYTAAVAARLAGGVVALEEDAELAAAARSALAAASAEGVDVVVGPLAAGVPSKAPFDVVFFDGSVEVVPEGYAAQLAPGGRMVVVEGQGLAGRARVYTVVGGELSGRKAFNSNVRPLPGFARERVFEF